MDFMSNQNHHTAQLRYHLELKPRNKTSQFLKKKQKQISMNNSHHRINILFKSLLVLVIQLLRVVMWGLLRTHIIYCSNLKLRRKRNSTAQTNLIKQKLEKKDTYIASYSPPSKTVAREVLLECFSVL